jgi:hypothetical protein
MDDMLSFLDNWEVERVAVIGKKARRLLRSPKNYRTGPHCLSIGINFLILLTIASKILLNMTIFSCYNGMASGMVQRQRDNKRGEELLVRVLRAEAIDYDFAIGMKMQRNNARQKGSASQLITL